MASNEEKKKEQPTQEYHESNSNLRPFYAGKQELSFPEIGDIDTGLEKPDTEKKRTHLNAKALSK